MHRSGHLYFNFKLLLPQLWLQSNKVHFLLCGKRFPKMLLPEENWIFLIRGYKQEVRYRLQNLDIEFCKNVGINFKIESSHKNLDLWLLLENWYSRPRWTLFPHGWGGLCLCLLDKMTSPAHHSFPPLSISRHGWSPNVR